VTALEIRRAIAIMIMLSFFFMDHPETEIDPMAGLLLAHAVPFEVIRPGTTKNLGIILFGRLEAVGTGFNWLKNCRSRVFKEVRTGRKTATRESVEVSQPPARV
jgi:hypothetical protein